MPPRFLRDAQRADGACCRFANVGAAPRRQRLGPGGRPLRLSTTAPRYLLASATADLATATELELAPGATVFHSVIVHCENERPIQVENRYIRPAFAVDYLTQDFTCRTPYDYLMSLGPLEEVEHVIQALIPDETTRALLAMPEGDRYCICGVGLVSGGVVVTSARLVHPGSGYSMVERFRVGKKCQGRRCVRE